MPWKRTPRDRVYSEQTQWEAGLIVIGFLLMPLGPLVIAQFTEPYFGPGEWFDTGLVLFTLGWVIWGGISVFIRFTRKKVTGTHMTEAAWWEPTQVPTTHHTIDQETLKRELPSSEWEEVDAAVAEEGKEASGGGDLPWWWGVDGGVQALTIHIMDANKQGFTRGLGDPKQYYFHLGRNVIMPFDTETTDHSQIDPRNVRWVEWKFKHLWKRDTSQVETVTRLNEDFGQFIDRSFHVWSRVLKKMGIPYIAHAYAEYVMNVLMVSEKPGAIQFREQLKKGSKEALAAAFKGWVEKEQPQLQVPLGHNEARMEAWRAKALGLQSENTWLRSRLELAKGESYDRDRADREVARRRARGSAPSQGPVFDEASRAPAEAVV